MFFAGSASALLFPGHYDINKAFGYFVAIEKRFNTHHLNPGNWNEAFIQ